MAKILVVDDERDIRESLELVLGDEGYAVDGAADGLEAIARLKAGTYDLVITDLKMSGADGYEVLRQSRKLAPTTPVVMITAFGSIDSAVEAMKLGAEDYIVKPFQHGEISITIGRLLERRQLALDGPRCGRRLNRRFDRTKIVGTSPAIAGILAAVEKVAPTRANILITGESGTGKGLIAEAIHRNSPRKDRPFLSINCAAIPEPLLESELMGYKRGAFTGANTDKPGLMTLADGGTLFLDEIGDMPAMLQSKSLKVLESGEVLALGDTKSARVDVRLISATNKNLQNCIEEKAFREDLYYRLNVIEIHIPPLRERREDIPQLARHFLGELAAAAGSSVRGFAPGALEALSGYIWPGNVRELRNVIERALVFAGGDTISRNDLPPQLIAAASGNQPATGSPPPQALREMVTEYEKGVIARMLNQTNGNKEIVARNLGLDLTTLYRKLHKFELAPNWARK
ncbi:sigma-54-dependent transcriptional regulator [Desulfurivibrio sp. C05AmB]|uniref:sigma-54-dependent transcriptional regulator n=1 Tax=Desulfurivibrio sp. C05AmB TaxID=3374371 RepID=UPI00376F28A4